MADAEFAQRIRERYPEGLTGLFAIGATRRTYILDRNRHRKIPVISQIFPNKVHIYRGNIIA